MSSPLRKADAVADQVLAVGRAVVWHLAEALLEVVDLMDRSFEHRLDQPIHQVMTCSPVIVRRGTMINKTIASLQNQKIRELPVVDQNCRPLGMIDITDVIAFLPGNEVTTNEHDSMPRLSVTASLDVIPLNSQQMRRVDEA